MDKQNSPIVINKVKIEDKEETVFAVSIGGVNKFFTSAEKALTEIKTLLGA